MVKRKQVLKKRKLELPPVQEEQALRGRLGEF
jgi:hypothetical protein